MNWEPTEMMQAVTELSGQILKDDDAWQALAEAELLTLDDLLDIATLLVAVGEHGAQIPVFETLVLGAPARGDLPVDAVLTGALHETGARDPNQATTACRDGKLYGTKICVPAIDRAVRVVVPASDGLYWVRTEDCQIRLGMGTNDDPVGELILDGVPANRIGDLDAVAAWTQRAQVGLCALSLGLSKTGLRMTANYARERKQFGKPIGTFQAVGQRLADAWIDVEAMDVTLWQAAWRVSEGRSSEREVRIARYWACEGSHRVLAAAQHIHGGMGFDRDYALHRYFLTAKHWEFALGGAGAQLQALGGLLATPRGRG
ncbi:MAG: acyl-CoA dehydrogenase [Rhodobacterales bacterium]|nr:acyl-CoA dehydrogenase [Rhodobacterales bacterium]